MMRDHELVNVKKHNQHKHDSCRGNSACRWHEKTDSAEYLCRLACTHKCFGMCIVVSHDMHIESRMPEMVDTA